jgi:hypothetical protein
MVELAALSSQLGGPASEGWPAALRIRASPKWNKREGCIET